MSSEEDKKKSEMFEGLGETYRQVAPFLTVGIQLAAAVVAFFFIGTWVDRKFETAPWGSLAGIALGMFGGFWKFFRSARELIRQNDSQEPPKREP